MVDVLEADGNDTIVTSLGTYEVDDDFKTTPVVKVVGVRDGVVTLDIGIDVHTTEGNQINLGKIRTYFEVGSPLNLEDIYYNERVHSLWGMEYNEVLFNSVIYVLLESDKDYFYRAIMNKIGKEVPYPEEEVVH